MKRLAVLSAAAAMGALLLISCSHFSAAIVAPPEIPGAQFVGNKACYECHTNITRAFPASAHARIHVDSAQMKGSTGCESCHGPGSKHIEAGGGRGKFIVNPGKNPSACYHCHLEVQAEFRLPQHHAVERRHLLGPAGVEVDDDDGDACGVEAGHGLDRAGNDSKLDAAARAEGGSNRLLERRVGGKHRHYSLV